MNWVLHTGGRSLAAFLSKPRYIHMATPPTPRDILLASLRPADVLLVEGDSMISSAIRYLTHSTWSHAALYVGPGAGTPSDPDHLFVEADINAGGALLDWRSSLVSAPCPEMALRVSELAGPDIMAFRSMAPRQRFLITRKAGKHIHASWH